MAANWYTGTEYLVHGTNLLSQIDSQTWHMHAKSSRLVVNTGILIH